MEHNLPKTRNKSRAIVALSSVVGISAVVTLAAWTASTYLKGTVTTGTLTGIQSSTNNGTTWSVITDTSATPQILTLAGATAMAPGTTAYSAFRLRAATGTTVAVPISFTTASAGVPSVTGLRYAVYDTGATTTCDAAAVTAGTQIVPLTAVVGTVNVAASLFTLPAGTAGTFGASKNLCLTIIPDATVGQTISPSVQWSVSANF